MRALRASVANSVRKGQSSARVSVVNAESERRRGEGTQKIARRTTGGQGLRTKERQPACGESDVRLARRKLFYSQDRCKFFGKARGGTGIWRRSTWDPLLELRDRAELGGTTPKPDYAGGTS